MRKFIIAAAAGAFLAGCASSEVVRTSANTILIDAGAAPACGPGGASRVAAKTAAIETIKNGFERYVISGAAAQNNVTVIATRSSTIVSGSHDRQLAVVMFRRGDPGFDNALDARQELGPNWQEIVKNGVWNCL